MDEDKVWGALAAAQLDEIVSELSYGIYTPIGDNGTSLSGGQRQRAVIARALATEPKLLICDESVAALDISVQAQVLNLLNELKEDYGFTYIFISHDLAVVKFMADQLLVMKDGKIEEIGDADEIYANPNKEYTQKLINAIPKGIWDLLLQWKRLLKQIDWFYENLRSKIQKTFLFKFRSWSIKKHWSVSSIKVLEKLNMFYWEPVFFENTEILVYSRIRKNDYIKKISF